jgi:hypothetical protein
LPFRINRIFINHHRRRRYNDRPANDYRLGDDRSPLLDNDGGRRSVIIGGSFPLIATNFAPVNFAIGSYGQIGGHGRRGKS